MAASYAHLWPGLVCWENLLRAYHRCRRRKRFKRGAVEFDFSWETNLIELQRELHAGTYAPGPYRHFFIHDPKRRKISAAPFRDRIVHHAAVQVLEPIWEPRFIYDSYACRRGKGTHRALARAQRYLKRHAYVLKTDIVRFFPNVDHQVLLDALGRRVRDRRLMDLIMKIIASGEGVLADEATDGFFPGDDLFAALRPRGLPIGNLTSQFFANVLLDRTDHFIKEQLRVPGYVCYADDLLLFGDDKDQLWGWRDAVSEQLAALRLRLHRHKTQLRPSKTGVNFLGFVVRPDELRLQQRALARFNRRLRRLRYLWRHRAVAPAAVRASLRAWSAHAADANSAGVRRAIWRRVRFTQR